MTHDEFKGLAPGDIVESAATGAVALVVVNFGDRVTAVNTYDLTNPEEWTLIRKVTTEPRR